MNYNNLSLEQAPSIKTPLRFFITAPVFLIAASLLLIIQGPEIIQNRWLPQTLALTHLITLGFVSMVMIGALFQLLPVLAGSNIPHAKYISFLVHILYTPGTIFLVLGFLYSSPIYHTLSLFLLAPALLIFLTATSLSLFKSKAVQASPQSIKLSILSFWIAVALALTLLSSYAWQNIPLLRQYTELHIGWAMIGWMVIMVVSVAYQVIPMFQITGEYSDAIKRYLSTIVFSSLLIWSISRTYELQSGQSLYWLTLSIIIICSSTLLIFTYSSIKLLLGRKKRMADTSLYFWITSLLSLSISLIMFIFAELTHQDLSMIIGILFFAGFAISAIIGMLYKIIPFLIWLHLHRNLTREGKRLSGIPTIYEIISHKKSQRLFVIHILTLATTLLSLLNPALFFYPASLLWLLNSTLLMTHLLQALHTYRSFLNANQ